MTRASERYWDRPGACIKVRMMQGHEEFKGETDRAEELPMPFFTETVSRILAE